MRKTLFGILIGLVSLCGSFIYAEKTSSVREVTQAVPTHALAPYFGTYLGISPTGRLDDPLVGEIKITINSSEMRVLFANGYCIADIHEPLSGIRALSSEEIRSLFLPGEDMVHKVDGFRVRETGPILLFWRHPERSASGALEAKLVIPLNGINVSVPAVLYDQAQVDQGAFDALAARVVAIVGWDGLPRLSSGTPCPES